MAKGDGQQMPNALAGAGMNPQISGMNRFGGLIPMLAQYGQMMQGAGGGAASNQPSAGGPNFIGPSQQGMSNMLGNAMQPRPDMGLGNVGTDQLQQQDAPGNYGSQTMQGVGPSNNMMQALQGLRRRPMGSQQMTTGNRTPTMGNQGPRRELV